MASTMSKNGWVVRSYVFSSPLMNRVHDQSDFEVVNIKPKQWEEEDIDVAISHCGQVPVATLLFRYSLNYFFTHTVFVAPIYTSSQVVGVTLGGYP
jgi:hypothetical protein